jgi:hypothetical protein
VLGELQAQMTSSAAAAARMHQTAITGRDESSDLDAVRGVMLGGLSTQLAKVSLAGAAILMRGPREDVDAGFAALGRTPSAIR